MSRGESSRRRRSSAPGCYLSTAVGALITIVIIEIINPAIIPFDFFQFFKFEGSLEEVLTVSLPLFGWAAGLTLLVSVLTRNNPIHNLKAEAKLGEGCLFSAFAGIFEEISFRWLIFFAAIFGLLLTDWLLLGFVNIHIIQFVYVQVLIPIANFFTLGLLEPYLYSSLGWAVGAAIISSNGDFRNGHAYLGLFGYVNSWFIGMFLFLLMFKYGLLAAILVHFLYDLLIFIVRYLDSVFERRMGWI